MKLQYRQPKYVFGFVYTASDQDDVEVTKMPLNSLNRQTYLIRYQQGQQRSIYKQFKTFCHPAILSARIRINETRYILHTWVDYKRVLNFNIRDLNEKKFKSKESYTFPLKSLKVITP